MESKILFKLTTIKAKFIVKLFEILKSYIHDIKVLITKDNLQIIENSNDTGVVVRLFAKNFEEYTCNKDTIFSINNKSFHNILKTVSKNDNMTLYMEKDNDDILNIIITDENGRLKHYKLKTLEYENNFFKMEEMDLDYKINIPSDYFHKIIKDINGIDSENIDIISSSKELIFQSNNTPTSCKVILHEYESQNSNVKSTKFERFSSELVQGKFKISNLLLFSKSCKLGENMNIYLSNGSPLILEYFVGDLGIMKFICEQVET